MPTWRWVLTDNDYVPQGELLNIRARKLALPLNKMATASFQMRLDNPLAEKLESAHGYIKVYRDNTLLFYGPTISIEEAATKDEQTLVVNAADPSWFLQKRLQKDILRWAGGTAPLRSKVIANVIDRTNDENMTGIFVPTYTAAGTITSAPTSFGTFTGPNFVRAAFTSTDPLLSGGKLPDGVGIGGYRTIMDLMREVQVGSEGFDWAIVPYDNHAAGARADSIGEFRTWTLFGEDRHEAVFEYGTGRHNVQDFKRTVSREGQANKVYHLTQDGPESTVYPVVSAIDSSSITEWKLLEDLAQAELLSLDFRQRLVDEHVRVRAQPRHVIEFTPHVFRPDIMPNFGTDYRLGDNVRARIKYNRRIKFDGLMRVWGVTFDVDDMGVERVALMLAEEA